MHKAAKNVEKILKIGIDIALVGWYTSQGLYRFAFYGANVSTDSLTVDYKPPSIDLLISYRIELHKRKREALHPLLFFFLLRQSLFETPWQIARQSVHCGVIVACCTSSTASLQCLALHPIDKQFAATHRVKRQRCSNLAWRVVIYREGKLLQKFPFPMPQPFKTLTTIVKKRIRGWGDRKILCQVVQHKTLLRKGNYFVILHFNYIIREFNKIILVKYGQVTVFCDVRQVLTAILFITLYKVLKNGAKSVNAF